MGKVRARKKTSEIAAAMAVGNSRIAQKIFFFDSKTASAVRVAWIDARSNVDMPIYLENSIKIVFDRVLAKTNFDLGLSGRPPALGTSQGETRGGSTPGGGIFFRKN